MSEISVGKEKEGCPRYHQGKVARVDFFRANGLKKTDDEKWMNDFVKGGIQNLK